MAKVIVEFRVLPASVEVNLEKLEEKVASTVSPHKITREPIAFGLVALRVIKIVEDRAGEIDEIESTLKKLDGVGQVEVIEVTRTIF